MIANRNTIFSESTNKDTNPFLEVMKKNVTEVYNLLVTTSRFIPFVDAFQLYENAKKVKGNTDDIYREACAKQYGPEAATSYFELLAVIWILRDATGKFIRSELQNNQEFRKDFNSVKDTLVGTMLKDLIVAKFGYGECGERATKLIFTLILQTEQPLHRVNIEKDDTNNHVFVLAGELPDPFNKPEDLKNIPDTAIYGDALFKLAGNGNEIKSITDFIPFLNQCHITVTSINPIKVKQQFDIINSLVERIYVKMSNHTGLFEVVKERAAAIKENGKIVEQAQPKLALTENISAESRGHKP